MKRRSGSESWYLIAGLLGAAIWAVPVMAEAPDPTMDDPFAEVITFRVPSADGQAVSRAIVVVPGDYHRRRLQPAGTGVPAALERFPVIYVLHGFSGNYTNWYVRMRSAGRPLSILADRHRAILVLPDGKFSSWYLDAADDVPDSADWQWETAMTRHLVPEIDRRYRIWAEPAGRGITGLSMGGHGALYLAARHPDLFAACGAMSGVMDLTGTTRPYDLARRLGPMEEHRERWVEHSMLNQAEAFAGREVGVLIDCGRDDVFFPDHQALRDRLVELEVPHDYIERPGGHTWDYWVNALPYHVQFLADRLRPAGVPETGPAPLPYFEAVVVDEGFPEDPYGIDVADMNGNGRPDILLTRFDEVCWYENPRWTKHLVATDATERNCYGILGDITGDGVMDVVVASDWDPQDTSSGGALHWLEGRREATGPWPIFHIHDEPTMHRMHWVDVNGDGTKDLIAQPLFGRGSTAPHYAEAAVRLLLFRVPADPRNDPWPMEVIDETLIVSHNFIPVQFDDEPGDELLAVSFDGVHLFKRRPDGSWSKRRLAAGEQETGPSRGGGEVAFGKLRDGTRFIATIEPWHGFKVVVYIEPDDGQGLWHRFVIDDTLEQGHAIRTGDLNGDGNDEIVAGYRGPNRAIGEPTSVKAYQALDAAAGRWQTHWIDRGGMATEDLRIVDLNGNGRLDIVAAGRSTRNVKVYFNRGR